MNDRYPFLSIKPKIPLFRNAGLKDFFPRARERHGFQHPPSRVPELPKAEFCPPPEKVAREEAVLDVWATVYIVNKKSPQERGNSSVNAKGRPRE